METYRSRYSAEDLDNTIGLVHGLVVPHVGDNGNWFVGETDTGVFAKGIDVTGAEVGQIVKVTEVDENGRPLAWEAVEMPTTDIELIADIVLEEETGDITITTDLNGKPFSLLGYYIYVCCSSAPSKNYLDYFRVYAYDSRNTSVTPLCVSGGPNTSRTYYEAMVHIELSDTYAPLLETLRSRNSAYAAFTIPGQNGNWPYNMHHTGPIVKLVFTMGSVYPVGSIIKIFKTR